MPYIEADCALIKEDNKLIGLSLVAQPQFEVNMLNGKGDIKFSDGKITLISGEDEVSFAIEESDAYSLGELLLGGRGEITIHRNFLAPGFKIVLIGKENGEKTKLKRI